jgi:hypothetical protein
MGKGSGRRPKGLVSDQKLQDNWDRIFNAKPNSDQFEQNGAVVKHHIEKVAWRDEMVKEDHEKSIRERNDGDITDTENS